MVFPGIGGWNTGKTAGGGGGGWRLGGDGLWKTQEIDVGEG